MECKYFGKVFKIPFPFTDLSGRKSRPALAISEQDKLNDIEFLFITTKETRGFNRVIPIEKQDFAEKKLLFESIVHIGKPYLLNALVVGKHLCTMTDNPSSWPNVQNRLYFVFCESMYVVISSSYAQGSLKIHL